MIEPDITEDQLKLISSLLEEFLPHTSAWIYGSRVTGSSKPYSDLDMVVFTKPHKSLAVMELREAFEDSNLPFRVDLFVWDDIPEKFRNNIEGNHIVLK